MSREAVWTSVTLGKWPGRAFPATEQDGAFVELSIPSSRGDGTTYSVIVDAKTITCDCPSYEFRSYCRHVTEVKKVIDTRAKEKKS